MMSSPEGRQSAKPAAGYVGRLACFLRQDSLVAIQIPANTARRPTTRLIPIGSPNVSAPTAEANTGLIVKVMAVRVGVVRSRPSQTGGWHPPLRPARSTRSPRARRHTRFAKCACKVRRDGLRCYVNKPTSSAAPRGCGYNRESERKIIVLPCRHLHSLAPQHRERLGDAGARGARHDHVVDIATLGGGEG